MTSEDPFHPKLFYGSKKEKLMVPIFNSLGKEGRGYTGHGAGKLSAASQDLACDGQSCTGEQGLLLSPMVAKRVSCHPSAVPRGLKLSPTCLFWTLPCLGQQPKMPFH